MTTLALHALATSSEPGWGSWQDHLHHFVQHLIALACALCIGWEREQGARSAGLRTFPLVAVASCGYIQIARSVMFDETEALARVLYGLMTGIGFIGGGAILKSSGNVRGTATAASIWNTGAIGAAVAFERYHVAVVLTVVNVIVLRLSRPLKEQLNSGGRSEEEPG